MKIDLRKTLFLFLVFLFWFKSLACAGTNLRCEVDKESIGMDEELVYKLIVSSSEKNIPAPKLPAFEGFDIVSQAQSSTAVFGQGSPKTILVYAYILTPLQPGKFKIGPSTIAINDKTYACEEIEIEVSAGNRPSDRQPQEKLKPLPEKGLPDAEGPQFTL